MGGFVELMLEWDEGRCRLFGENVVLGQHYNTRPYGTILTFRVDNTGLRATHYVNLPSLRGQC